MNSFIPIISIIDERFFYDIILLSNAVNIDYKVIDNTLFVKESNYQYAIDNINKFIKENYNIEVVNIVNEHNVSLTFSYFIIILFIFFYFFTKFTNFSQWLEIGGNNAYKVINGEFWRCITSLTLHKDILHIFSNMIFFLILIKPIVLLLKEGRAWIFIILSGFIGNLISDYFYQRFHVSIGFSTSVFGCVGILAYFSYLSKDTNKILEKFLPFAAGIGLLALIGTGKGVDLIAHLTGFLSGIFISILYRIKPSILPDTDKNVYRVLALLIFLVSWIIGFTFS